MSDRNYYDILGIERDASSEAVKNAYRKLARRYHPDVSDEVDAEEKFKEVSEAYEVLKDPDRREAYDAYGSHQGMGGPFPPGWNTDTAYHAEPGYASFSDLFEGLFGARGATDVERDHGAFRMRGSDQMAHASISIEDSFIGRERVLELDDSVRARKLKFKVPKGITEGQRVRLAGQGMAGYGGERAGDLLLEVKFLPHPIFRCEGRDVLMTLPITPWEAALGAKVQAPTLGGPVNVAIAPGTQAGARLRLNGRGLPGNPAGDQILEVAIKMPVVDSDEKREVFELMRDRMDFDPRTELFAA